MLVGVCTLLASGAAYFGAATRERIKPLGHMATRTKPEWLCPHKPGEELWAVMVDADQRYGMVTQEQWQNYPYDSGWITISTEFSKPEANAYVEKCWTDMCPKSHRDALRAEGCCGYDTMTFEEYESLSVPIQYIVFMEYKAQESARWDANLG